MASSYRPDTRLLPVILSVILISGICIRAVITQIPDREKKLSGKKVDSTRTIGGTVGTHDAIIAFAWLGALVGSVILFGFMGGIWTFVAVFVARYEDYRRGLAVSSLTILFVYILFVVLLDLSMLESYPFRLLEQGEVLVG